MDFLRRRRHRPAGPGPGSPTRRLVVVADLHVDFTAAGPMAAPGSVEAAVKLADLVRGLQRAWQDREEGAAAGALAVEGRRWGERVPLPPDCPWPAHCEGPAQLDLAAALIVAPSPSRPGTASAKSESSGAGARPAGNDGPTDRPSALPGPGVAAPRWTPTA